ncbi:MAG: cell division ATP-binding protein FtsE [Butyricicoccaceae bacterium]
MIKMQKVSMVYGNGIHAIREMSLEIADGEFVFLVGESGSGKSTITKLLTAELRPTSGMIQVGDFRLDKIRRRQIPKLRRTLGVVFQDFRLIENKTVYENVEFVMRAVGTRPRLITERVREVLRQVGIAEKTGEYPKNLSGGEQQRASIARALANRPQIIIADEPTGNIDPARSLEIMQLLREINRQGTTVLVVTHEKALVDSMGERVITIHEGRIVSDQKGGYEA